MSYLSTHLMPKEHLAATTELHWVVFLKPVFFSLVFILFLFYRPLNLPRIIDIGGSVIITIAWLLAFIRYISTEFGVSKQRVLMKHGFIQVRTLDMLVSRIESVQLHQSLIGGMLGYGTVAVRGTGGDQVLFTQVNAPAVFRLKILEQTDDNIE